MSALRTALCERLRIEVPIVQAPIGSAASPALVAAVADAGGLGMLALTWHTPDQARAAIRQVRSATTNPFAVNLGIDFPQLPVADVLAVCLAEGVPIISTFWGEAGAYHEQIAAAAAIHLHSVGSPSEARRAVEAGVDVVVAQGWEAGGHVRGEIATMALVPAVVDAVSPIPVIAAGGIADGRGLAAALSLGAQGALLGTRFLAATEAATHEVYQRRILESGSHDARYTYCFDGGWPDAAHRALRNATLDQWEAAGSPRAPHRPGEGDIVATGADGRPHLRYEVLIPRPGTEGDVVEMAMYAGQSVALVNDARPAGEIVRSIANEATDVIRGLAA